METKRKLRLHSAMACIYYLVITVAILLWRLKLGKLVWFVENQYRIQSSSFSAFLLFLHFFFLFLIQILEYHSGFGISALGFELVSSSAWMAAVFKCTYVKEWHQNQEISRNTQWALGSVQVFRTCRLKVDFKVGKHPARALENR